MPNSQTMRRSLAHERADVYEELANDVLRPGQTYQTDGSVANVGGLEAPVGDIGEIMAAIVIEGDSRFMSVPVDTIQALALAAFRLGVEAVQPMRGQE